MVQEEMNPKWKPLIDEILPVGHTYVAQPCAHRFRITQKTRSKMKNNYSVSGLYYRYGRTEDAQLKEWLGKIQVCHLLPAPGRPLLPYPLVKQKLIRSKPRNVSITFDAVDVVPEPLEFSQTGDTFAFLVKSTSRFFLKPDIGEVIDQLTYDQRMQVQHGMVAGIGIDISDYMVLPETDGEHFIMWATIFLK